MHPTSSRLGQITNYAQHKSSDARVILPPIRPAPPRDQESNRSYYQDLSYLPAILPKIQQGRRQSPRTWKRKDRDVNFWRRVFESPNPNEEEKLLIQLRAMEGLPWKEIVVKFNEKMGVKMLQPALQMKLTRLACRMDSQWAQKDAPNAHEVLHSNPPSLSPQLPSQLIPQISSVQPPQPQPQPHSQLHYQFHFQHPHQASSHTVPQYCTPPYTAVNQGFFRDDVAIIRPGNIATASVPGAALWPGIVDSPYCLTSLSPMSYSGDMLYYDYQAEPQPSHRHHDSSNQK